MLAGKLSSWVEDPKNLGGVDSNWMERQTRYSVDSTPTFLINGQAHGPMPYAEWKRTLDRLVQK